MKWIRGRTKKIQITTYKTKIFRQLTNDLFLLTAYPRIHSDHSFKVAGYSAVKPIAATSCLVCTAAATRLCTYLVVAICCMNSNQFEFVQQIAATKFCRSEKILSQRQLFSRHTGRFVAATCRGDVSQRFVASCVSAFNVPHQYCENGAYGLSSFTKKF